ncbi:MAG: polysaccharide biosynthesis tyrosine autokinase [Caldilineaceae bacterium]|nr:polysaccharide biosynthesis tyrosine autokinase [Caldilineaceae bacterium]
MVGLEVLQFWRVIKKRLWIIILFLILAGVGSSYYILQQVPLYRTTTTLVINPAVLTSALSAQISYQLGDTVIPLANTYTELMRTSQFAKLIKDDLEVEISEADIINAIGSYYVRDTQLFRITATYSDPAIAQDLANTTANLLIKSSLERAQAERAVKLQAQFDPRRLSERNRLVELNATLQQELDYYADLITRMEAQIAGLNIGPQSEEIDAEILRLRQELLSYRSERISVLSALSDAQTALVQNDGDTPASDIDTVVIAEEAPLITVPLPRDFIQPVLAALSIALALGVGLAWLLEYIDYTIKTPEEMDEIYGMATQGVIGAVASSKKRVRREESLITMTQPRSPIAEAFRVLRTSVRMAGLGAPIRTLMVTSAGPGEGKTFVTTNLAVSLAQEGKRVILVDLDLRRPQVHKAFGFHREPGFTNLVVDKDMPLEQAMFDTPVPTLKVIPCGTIPPNPAELLGSPRALDLMERLKEHADMVLYDTPPAATVTDAVIVATRVDAVLQVVHAGTVRIDLVRRCKHLLEIAGARILGPVLNQVRMGDLGYYYYHYSGYYHGENEERPKKRSGLGSIFSPGADKAPAQPRRGVNGNPLSVAPRGATEEPLSEPGFKE